MSYAERKIVDTLRAKCALAGVALVESSDDRDRPVFVVSRWSLTKQLDSLEAVEEWLARVTGKPVETQS
jgi:hypothetical protein